MSEEERMARMIKRGDCIEDVLKQIAYDEQAFDPLSRFSTN